MTSNIVLSKGDTSVTIDTTSVVDSYKNNIINLRIPQVKQNQDSGPRETKIVDLLRVDHTIKIIGYICKDDSTSAEVLKDNLVYLWKGSGQKGGTVSLSYEGNSSAFTSTTDTNPIYGIITDLLITEDSLNEDASGVGVIKYNVQITFVEGVTL